MENKQKLLIIDDDTELCDLLREYLTGEGYNIKSCFRGDEGLSTALSEHFDLLILDVMLPVIDGFEILKQIRSKTSMAVIMLTARGEEIDRIIGLELGADDYLAKPFNPRELLARIKAIFRRLSPERLKNGNSNRKILIGDLEVNVATRSLIRNGEELHLTEVEFHILEILLTSVGKVINRQDLALQALGHKLAFDDRSLDVHISNVRKKLGNKIENGTTERIRTIRGVGYMYVDSEA
ncbi:MAG: response regulator transcription factor [Candidatus Riflebacteria bacterium]|nr:response regulator transcription factor [Candidatus Riflebacteria bacterium]